MRLTLRTLIAFRDQVLPEAQQNQLAERIRELDFAQQLLNRCESLRSSSGISDALWSLDANITANYLDSVLDVSATEQFEQVALTDDNLLSEVAECHEILADYEERLHREISDECRLRVRDLIAPPVESEASQDASHSPRDLSEYEVQVRDDPPTTWLTRQNLVGPFTSAVVNGLMLVMLSLLTAGAVRNVQPIELSISKGKELPEVVVDMPSKLSLEIERDEFSETIEEPIDMELESAELDDHFFEQSLAETVAPAKFDLASFLAHGGPKASGSVETGGAPSVKYYGQEYSANNVVYIVDASGSMRGARFARATEELLYSLSHLQTEQKFAVLFFSGRTVRSYPGATRLVRATRTNVAKARRLIRSIRPHGGTEPARSIIDALDRNPELVFFLSDGEVPDSTVGVAKDANTNYAVINTIGFEFRFGAHILRLVAEQNGGKYRFVP
ncbi:MAG: hypothetical protein KDB27_19335 [Planctomycetales bacterium]|nr:hypothetical protein [Planctomycetales bacterium]